MLKVFDHMINIANIDLDNTLVNKTSNENTLVYDVAYKSPYGSKPLRFIFDKVGGYIKKYDKIR